MSDLAEKIEELGYDADEFLTADGFDGAAVGIVERFGAPPVICYDTDLVLEEITRTGDMDYDGAVEYFEYNVLGAYCGERTPVYMRRW